MRACAIGNHADQVPLAVEPRARFHAVVGLGGGIKRKAVVVLRDEHDVADAGGFRGLDPLIGVNVLRMEDARRGRAVAPFAVEKGVGTEVDDGAHLHVLPRDLLRRWLHIDSVLRDRCRRASARTMARWRVRMMAT